MSKPVRRPSKRWGIEQWAGAGVAAALATVGVVALRHALETPQPLKSQLPGEALLYRWQRRSIFYKILGSPDAPPLVLLHTPEIGASSHEMQHILSPLAQTYCVYALDLLGFGLSDRPALEYSAAMYHELCRDFLRDVVKRPATLLASGLSCNYAIAVAWSAPSRCNDLILIAPRTLQEGQQPLFSWRDLVEMPFVKMLLYPLLSTRPAFLLMRNQQQDGQSDFAHFYAQTHQFGAEHAAMARLAGKLTETTTRPFQTLKQPILMIWGMQALEDQSTLANMRAAATLVDPTHHTREVEIIPHAGLMAHRDQPESVVAAIKRWQAERIAALPEPEEAITTASFQEQVNIAESAPFEASQPQQPAANVGELPPSLELQQDAHTPGEFFSLPVYSTPQTQEISLNTVGEDEQEAPAGEEALIPTPSEEPAPIPTSTPSIEQESDPPSINSEPGLLAIMAYCVKCKQKREVLNAQEVTMKNGRRAVRGTCAVCGGGIYRIGGLG